MAKTVIYEVGKVIHKPNGEHLITGWTIQTDTLVTVTKDNQILIWGFSVEVLSLISEVFHKKYKKQ